MLASYGSATPSFIINMHVSQPVSYKQCGSYKIFLYKNFLYYIKEFNGDGESTII